MVCKLIILRSSSFKYCIVFKIKLLVLYTVINYFQMPNPCEQGKCSDICLLAPKTEVNSKGYSCACPDDKKLSEDGIFCITIAIPPTLIVGTPTSIIEIEQEHLGRQKAKKISLKNDVSSISALTYNSLSGMLLIDVLSS